VALTQAARVATAAHGSRRARCSHRLYNDAAAAPRASPSYFVIIKTNKQHAYPWARAANRRSPKYRTWRSGGAGPVLPERVLVSASARPPCPGAPRHCRLHIWRPRCPAQRTRRPVYNEPHAALRQPAFLRQALASRSAKAAIGR
jgi:hypothetical protein